MTVNAPEKLSGALAPECDQPRRTALATETCTARKSMLFQEVPIAMVCHLVRDTRKCDAM